MNYVMSLSTDKNIATIGLDAGWDSVSGWYFWNQVVLVDLGIPNSATILVIAHCDKNEIGNAEPGEIDINAQMLLVLIQCNMANNAMPASVYVATYGQGIEQFAAALRLAAEQNNVWAHTRIYGYHDSPLEVVPPPNDVAWVEIF